MFRVMQLAFGFDGEQTDQYLKDIECNQFGMGT
jgi:hypothetical protein